MLIADPPALISRPNSFQIIIDPADFTDVYIDDSLKGRYVVEIEITTLDSLKVKFSNLLHEFWIKEYSLTFEYTYRGSIVKAKTRIRPANEITFWEDCIILYDKQRDQTY